jgi:preprotein translocase subunit YajC
MFISNAFAESGAQPQGGLMDQVLFFAPILLLAAYMIFSQFKRAKQHKLMTEALQRGDEVVTIGVEISENVEVLVQKTAIQSVLPKGTIKAIK